MKKRIFNKKGITMVESIIAILIVSLVTVTAVSIMLSSTHTTKSAIYKSEAQYFAEDALACFRAADNASQFGDAMEFRGGFLEFSITGSKHVFTLSGSKFKAVALVDYPADGRASFSIEILDGDETVITRIPRFEKGA